MNLNKVIFLFCTAQQVEFEEVVEKLHIMMDKSLLLVKARKKKRVFAVAILGVMMVFCFVCLFGGGV